MPTVIKEIIERVQAQHPEAPIDEIIARTKATIESIVTDGIKQLRLPPAPSLLKIRSAELLQKRTKRRVLRRKEKSEETRQAVTYELTRLQEELDGHLASSTVATTTLLLGDGNTLSAHVTRTSTPNITITRPTFQIPDGVPDEKLDVPLKEDELLRQMPYSLSFARSADTFPFNVILDPTSQKQIAAKPLVAKLFRKMETQLRTFAASQTYPLKFLFYAPKDVELPIWKKVVLKVVPPPELDFDSRVKIWESVDSVIRESITELEKSNSEDANMFANFGGNLFVHMVLT